MNQENEEKQDAPLGKSEDQTPIDQYSSPEDQTIEPYAEVSTENLKHSGLGIASFTMAILSFIITIILLVLIVNTVANTELFNTIDFESAVDQQEFAFEFQQEIERVIESNPQIIALLMSFFLVGALLIIGGILGFIGLFIKGRKKLFAILGTIFNVLGIPGVIISFFIAFGIGAGMNG